MNAANKYMQKRKRIEDAIALKEPDQIPLCPSVETYPFIHAGYTMADILYDIEKAKDAMIRYIDEYDPDSVFGYEWVNIGMGPIFEKGKPKNMRWAGSPNKEIQDNSIHQFIEYAILEDEEYEQFWKDRTGWILNKGFPKTSALCDPLKNLMFSTVDCFSSYTSMAGKFSTPEMKKMITELWELQELVDSRNGKMSDLANAIEDHGVPILSRGLAGVPFDNYSDFLRGTNEGLADLYERPEDVDRFREEDLVATLEFIKMQGNILPKGTHVFMALHKGFDGFMSNEFYKKYYWNDLQKIIYAIVDAGLVPYIFCEGKYESRLDFLKEVPKGKVIYRFETMDMIKAKKALGNVATISGGFSNYLLNYGTKQQVIDEVKRLIDGCSYGGGYIFDLDCAMDEANPENVEAMMDTVKTYGKAK